MTAILLCRSGDLAGLAHPITGGRCVVGRAMECDLVLLDADLSREHCLVGAREGVGHVVEDLGSKNGTALNGQRVSQGEARVLKHCDFLTLGGSVDFVYLELEKVPSSEVLAAALVGPDGAKVPLQLGTNVLGSDSTCDLICEDASLQPKHLKLHLNASELRAESEPGAPPFTAHGLELRAAALASGDLLVLSPTVEFGIEVVTGRAEASAQTDQQATWRDSPVRSAGPRSSSVAPTDETRIAILPMPDPDSTASLPMSDLAASLQKARERHAQVLAEKSDATGGLRLRARLAADPDKEAAALRRTWASKSVDAPLVAPAGQGLKAARREAAARVHVLLRDANGRPEERVTLLREGRHLVGRKEDCRVWIADLSVSREHAEIAVGPQGIDVKDLGSANGTWHEGARITTLRVPQSARIRFGDVQAWFDEI